MIFEHRVELAGPRDRAWRLLLDVPRVARCVPGAEEVTAEGGDRYRGALRLRLGPVGLRLEGQLQLTSVDPAGYQASLEGQAADRKVSGSVRARLQMRLEGDETSTTLVVRSELAVLGKLGEFGQPLIRKKADELMAAFAENVARALDGESPGR